jgi:hypothetical protein
MGKPDSFREYAEALAVPEMGTRTRKDIDCALPAYALLPQAGQVKLRAAWR